jgi:hypothetical protein
MGIRQESFIAGSRYTGYRIGRGAVGGRGHMKVVRPGGEAGKLYLDKAGKVLHRNWLLYRAVRQFLAARRKRQLRERLRRGYLEMAPLNLELAADGPWDEELAPEHAPARGGQRR